MTDTTLFGQHQFGGLLGDDTARLERLHRRLEAAAVGPDAPDVHYRTVESPVGQLLIAATEAGIVRIAFEREDLDAVIDTLATRVGTRILRTPARLDAPAAWLDAYFAGAHEPYAGALDLRLARGFRLQVLGHLRDVGYGVRLSYGALAAAAGNPGAVRATGTACATNPLPLVIPCHRIVRADGSIGAYLGGPETKARLLALESQAA